METTSNPRPSGTVSATLQDAAERYRRSEGAARVASPARRALARKLLDLALSGDVPLRDAGAAERALTALAPEADARLLPAAAALLAFLAGEEEKSPPSG